jgi:hypothetical protein
MVGAKEDEDSIDEQEIVVVEWAQREGEPHILQVGKATWAYKRV